MAKIFAITGAQRTGKTTIRRRVLELGPENFEYPPSPGELARKQGISIGRSGTDESHVFFARAHAQNLIKGARGEKSQFLDRCMIDHLAYVRLLSDDSKFIEINEALVELSASSYETVFLAQINYDLAPDPDNHEDPALRRDVQSQIVEIAKAYGFRHQVLPVELDQAADQVLRGLTI